MAPEVASPWYRDLHRGHCLGLGAGRAKINPGDWAWPSGFGMAYRPNTYLCALACLGACTRDLPFGVVHLLTVMLDLVAA